MGSLGICVEKQPNLCGKTKQKKNHTGFFLEMTSHSMKIRKHLFCFLTPFLNFRSYLSTNVREHMTLLYKHARELCPKFGPSGNTKH